MINSKTAEELYEIEFINAIEDDDEDFYGVYNRNSDYTPSSTAGDYSPLNPWDAPGMSIRDFI